MVDDGPRRDRDDLPNLARVGDEVFEVLRAPERRFVLYFLLEHPTVSVDELADVVTGWEGAGTHGMATRDDRERVRADLLHRHLPKLSGAGMVEYDRGTGTVRSTLRSPVENRLVRWAYRREGAGGRR